MTKKIIFDDDGYAAENSEDMVDEENEDLQDDDSAFDESEESQSVVEETASHPVKNYFEDSDDDDDAPEEVSMSSSKAHMMDIYKTQKEVAVTTKKRKRKARHIKVEDEIDEEMLKLLADNSASLTSETTLSKEEEVPNKHIILESEVPNPTRKVEKKVEGFKLVALPKKTNTAVTKKIDSSILDFQQRHFYGKGTKRVSAASFTNQKRAKPARRWIVCSSIGKEEGLFFFCFQIHF